MSANLYLFLVLIITIFRGYKFECKLTEDDLDKCMLNSMFFGSEKSIVPADDAEMTKHCTQVQEGVACMRQYSATCLQGFAQQVSGMILTNMGVHMEKRCNNPKDRSEFIENAKCFLPKEKMRPLDICSEKHTRYLEIASAMEKDEHIPGTCCGYQLFKHCIVKEAQKLCGDGHSQYWEEIFDDVASEAVTFACAQFDSKEQCSKLLKPQHWTQFHTIEESSDPAVWAHNYKTPIKFMMDMIKKFHMDSK